MTDKLRHQAGVRRAAALVLACALASAIALAAGISFAAEPGASQWSTVGGDLGNTRYSALAQINSQNVAKLGAAWISEKVGPPPSARAMPVIDGELLFLTAPPFVTAVSLTRGKSHGSTAWRPTLHRGRRLRAHPRAKAWR